MELDLEKSGLLIMEPLNSGEKKFRLMASSIEEIEKWFVAIYNTIVKLQINKNDIFDFMVEDCDLNDSIFYQDIDETDGNTDDKSIRDSKKNHSLNELIKDKQIKKLFDKLVSKTNPNIMYQLERSAIGKGGVGVVYIARSLITDKKVAIKKISIFSNNKNRLKNILNEIRVLSDSKHENIIEYISSYVVGDELWVFMEYMDRGSLFDLIQMPYYIPEDILSYIIKSILQALDYIHKSNRIHRDIKPENILISSTGDVKVADFGNVAQLSLKNRKRNTFAGTAYYMSAEIILREDYDQLVDIWSLGILAYEVSIKKLPYEDLAINDVIDAITNDKLIMLNDEICKYSDEFIDFVNNGCLKRCPSERSCAEKLLNHPFIEKASTKEEFRCWLQSATFDSNPCTIV